MLYKHPVAMEASKLGSHYKPMINNEDSLVRLQGSVLPLTVPLTDCDLPRFMDIAARYGSDQFAYVVTPNVDHLIRYFDDSSFRELYRCAGFVLLDSRFFASIARVVTGIPMPVCPGSDVTAQLFADVLEADDRVVIVGGTDEQAQILRETYGLDGLKHYNPPMGFINNPDAVEECLRFVESHSPFRFCLLAVGSPQQELLARALLTRGRARGLALCVGASINFLTGGERRAPKWVQNLCLEWLYRLLHNPTRMAHRYLVRGPRIFFLLNRLRFALRPVASPASDCSLS